MTTIKNIVENFLNDNNITIDKSSLKMFLKAYNMFVLINNTFVDPLNDADMTNLNTIEAFELIYKSLSPFTKSGFDTSSLKLFIKQLKNPDLNTDNSLNEWYKTLINVK
jgi:hypothetical protein